MGWFPDVFWLIGEWLLLLAISTLVGLAIGWFLWRRKPEVETKTVGISSVAVTADTKGLIDESIASIRNGTESLTKGASGDWVGQLDGFPDVLAAGDETSASLKNKKQSIDRQVEALTKERDDLKSRYDDLRSQLTDIETLVGKEEARNQGSE